MKQAQNDDIDHRHVMKEEVSRRGIEPVGFLGFSQRFQLLE